MKTILLSFFVLIYMLGQAQILGPEPFNGDILVHGTSAANTVWFAPDYNPPIAFSSTGGCPGGRIGYAGSWNSFWGNFVRLPQINAAGLDSIKLTFDVSHSYFAAHTADWSRFYIWADGGYKHSVSAVRINGSNVLYDSGANGKGFKFTETRSCASTEVVIDLGTVIDKSSVLIYLEPDCGYNNSNTYYVYFDNIEVANAGTTPFSVSCHSDTSMCIDNPAWTLNGCTPAGGIYSGIGVSSGVFSPAMAGAGTHSIKYKATDGVTTDSCYFDITVHPVPVLSVSISPNDTLCFAIPLTLTASGAQTIQWSNGVQNGIAFIPTSQPYIVIGTDANGCQSDSSVNIIVNSQPSVFLNLPYDSVCGYSMPVFPTYPLSGGLPQGGIYSGSNVYGTNLIGDIVMGNHYSVVYYTFTDNHSCSNSAADSVYMYNCDTGFPEMQNLPVRIYPNPSADAVYIIHDNSIKHLEIVSVDGKMVWSTSVNPESNTTTADISELEKGTYFLRWKSKDAAGAISFVKE